MSVFTELKQLYFFFWLAFINPEIIHTMHIAKYNKAKFEFYNGQDDICVKLFDVLLLVVGTKMQ